MYIITSYHCRIMVNVSSFFTYSVLYFSFFAFTLCYNMEEYSRYSCLSAKVIDRHTPSTVCALHLVKCGRKKTFLTNVFLTIKHDRFFGYAFSELITKVSFESGYSLYKQPLPLTRLHTENMPDGLFDQ